jgi:DNA-binding XRE family transcriptional regulator
MEAMDKAMTAIELKQLRMLLGWSQDRLAQELGVHRNTVARWEMGMYPVPVMVAKLVRLWTE